MLAAACGWHGYLAQAAEVPVYTYQVVHAWPHDPGAFTQGLELAGGRLYESTGLNGRSTLRQVELETGRVLREFDLAPEYFAEGITVRDGKVYQLTWRAEKGFIYSAEDLMPRGEFAYPGEGWGLTHDAHYLILSDGTSRLRFLDPVSFKPVKTVEVRDGATPVDRLNELEYVRGEVYANVWLTDRIARIDPDSGRVLGWIDLSGLLPAAERGSPDAVLNGIAYDEKTDRLLVTGKLWPRLYEIRLRRVEGSR